MATANKTQPTEIDIDDFVDGIADEVRREDSRKVLTIMKSASKLQPRVWSSGIVGFGDLHYKGAGGREGDWFKIGFAPRKAALSIYTMCDRKLLSSHLAKLGKYSTEGGCIYIKRLSDINLDVFKQMMSDAFKLTPDLYISESHERAAKKAATKASPKKLTVKKPVAKKTASTKVAAKKPAAKKTAKKR